MNNTDYFYSMIKMVNQRLKFHTLQKDWLFLDVYSATVDKEGKSNQKWHIDSHHLKPGFYKQAQQWLHHP
ncbi:MAG: hypothetical protein Q9M50_11870 [Methylococcales bacterium]|nr:hypothetical protein [Methylococcales bacterium]